MTIRIHDNSPFANRGPGYDHSKLAAAAMRHPGLWVSDEGDDVPKVNASHIQRGHLVDYRPAGAFGVRQGTSEGQARFYVRFAGVPLIPWTPGDGRRFAQLERTMDPDAVPDGTPEHVVKALRKLQKRAAKAGKKSKAGKHAPAES